MPADMKLLDLGAYVHIYICSYVCMYVCMYACMHIPESVHAASCCAKFNGFGKILLIRRNGPGTNVTSLKLFSPKKMRCVQIILLVYSKNGP
jgi:hypothetical protein